MLGELARLASSPNDDPAILCLLRRPDCKLAMLLESSVAAALELTDFSFPADECLEGGVKGEWWLEEWLDF